MKSNVFSIDIFCDFLLFINFQIQNKITIIDYNIYSNLNNKNDQSKTKEIQKKLSENKKKFKKLKEKLKAFKKNNNNFFISSLSSEHFSQNSIWGIYIIIN